MSLASNTRDNMISGSRAKLRVNCVSLVQRWPRVCRDGTLSIGEGRPRCPPLWVHSTNSLDRILAFAITDVVLPVYGWDIAKSEHVYAFEAGHVVLIDTRV